jgi:hypothetical protein
MPAGGEFDEDAAFPELSPTAKTLSARDVLLEPHEGHLGFASLAKVRCSCSNFPPHDPHVYS